MWIATNSGLCRYDGYNIKVYQNDPADTNSICHNNIRSNIIEDKEGKIWMGTLFGLNKLDPVTEKFTRYTHNPENPNSISSNGARSLFLDKDGVLWIGTAFNGGLNKYDSLTDGFTHYNLQPPDTLINNILSLHEDQSGIFWIGSSQGLYQFNRNNEKFTSITPEPPLPDNFIPVYRAIREDDKGNVWFLTAKAILSFIKDTGEPAILLPLLGGERQFSRNVAVDLLVEPDISGQTLLIASNGILKISIPSLNSTHILPDPADPKSLIGNSAYKIFRDETGILWVSTAYGLSILDKESTQFTEHRDFEKKYDGSAKVILEDSKGTFWIGTGDEGIIHFDSAMDEIHWYRNLKSDEEGNNLSGVVKDIIEDREGNIWAGDNKTGLYYLDWDKNEFIHCNLANRQIISSFIYDICEDSEGSIWVGTSQGVFKRKNGVKPISNFVFEPLTSPPMTRPVRSIHEDRTGNLWICVNALGIYCQTAELKGTNTFIHYAHDPEDEKSLSNNNIMSVYEDDQNKIWFGSRHGLNRFDSKIGKFERLLFDLNEASNFISDITGDAKGNLWLTTQNGLLRASLTSEVTIADGYKIKQFLPFKEIYLQKISRGKDGKMFIGGTNASGLGFITFYPDSIRDNPHIPPLAITKFHVRNIPIELDSSTIVKKHVQLDYNENFFTLEFSALDYSNPEKNQYAYFLEGLEDDWIYSGTRRTAYYTKVPPGEYTFRAKGSNNDGFWNNEGTSILITIAPPPWKTWWAYSLYVLFILAILVFIFRFYIKRQTLLHKLALEQVQTEKLEELDRLKSRFFANISHEFRTPLTLILGPLEKLRSEFSEGAKKNDLDIMQRNALRLQNLINQLLNLSKLESGKMKLQAREENIIAMVKGYIKSFESLAKQKKLYLDVYSDEETIKLFVDKDKFEKILYNLLSNAFKFTDEGGKILVEIKIQQSAVGSSKSEIKGKPKADIEGHVCIKISDTGIGMTPDQLKHIFDRFYQADDSYTKDQQGTGIGLALVKEFVELHHGTISCESQLGKGATFVAHLPLGKEHLKVEEVVDITIPENLFKQNEPTDLLVKQDLIVDEVIDPDNQKPLLLIVEDNDDLRYYIRSYLLDEYQVLEAIDGEMGLLKATEKIPDLVISDVMMPKMDGVEMCEKLKADECTSHIPVILLTARAGKESKIEGLETGADDFITKPFDIDELRTRIRNLVVQRKKLQQWFLKEFRKPGIDHMLNLNPPDLTSMDQKFYIRLIEKVLDNISNPEYKVEDLVSQMNLSHSQLHRKMVAITGQNANQYIRTIRLTRAAELIANKTATITEIAFEMGFNNLSYFAKCFRDQFGVLPSEYSASKS